MNLTIEDAKFIRQFFETSIKNPLSYIVTQSIYDFAIKNKIITEDSNLFVLSKHITNNTLIQIDHSKQINFIDRLLT